MLIKPAMRPVFAHLVRKLSDFKRDERGAIAIFVLLIFYVMMIFGGIAVDVMRAETRRVTLHETMDRAVLAAASLTQPDGVSPKVTAEDWFEKAGLGDEFTVDYTTPIVTAFADPSQRRVTAKARVRSYNHFMGMMGIHYLEAPVWTEAAQGVSQIEVMLVLDITGSMGSQAVPGDSKTKIAALRDAATEFVTLVKSTDVKNGVSIGMVPYAAQVNIPAAVRQQFNVTNVSSWDFVANAGVPSINCIEIPTSTYGSMALSTNLAMPMAAVADISTNVTTSTDYLAATTFPVRVGQTQRLCTTKNDNAGTTAREDQYNHVYLPTKDGSKVIERISQLTADGNTSIAIGMRWGTALIDGSDEMRDIYAAAGDGSVAGRPVNNDDKLTRKIIILMTDGSHVTNNHVQDAYKSGPSPIWLGSDGKFAIRFGSGAGPLNTGVKPHQVVGGNYCSGWALDSNREYFIPHLKRNSVKKKVNAAELEGQGTGAATTGACDPLAWSAVPRWSLVDSSGNPVLDGAGVQIAITGQQLDWSEVWRYLRVDYVARQLYMRSNVGGTTNFNTLMGAFRKTYLTNPATMDALLQQNCTAAKTAGVEIYGIAFAAPANGQAQISGCASPNEDNLKYYHNAANQADLTAAFRAIATDITELRLTQ